MTRIKKSPRVEYIEERLNYFYLLIRDYPEKKRRFNDDIIEFQREYKIRTGEYYDSPYISKDTNV